MLFNINRMPFEPCRGAHMACRPLCTIYDPLHKTCTVSHGTSGIASNICIPLCMLYTGPQDTPMPLHVTRILLYALDSSVRTAYSPVRRMLQGCNKSNSMPFGTVHGPSTRLHRFLETSLAPAFFHRPQEIFFKIGIDSVQAHGVQQSDLNVSSIG